MKNGGYSAVQVLGMAGTGTSADGNTQDLDIYDDHFNHNGEVRWICIVLGTVGLDNVPKHSTSFNIPI